MSKTGVFFKSRQHKTLDVILYLLDKRGCITYRQLFDILFHADTRHLVKCGRPVTFDNYIALTDGPFPVAAGAMLLDWHGKPFDQVMGSIQSAQRGRRIELMSVSDYRFLDNAALDIFAGKGGNNDAEYIRAVSYTHLTLPTKRIV